MPSDARQLLAAHLRRHARMLHRIACGMGRQADADDVIQVLYSRWWRRSQREPGWMPPEEAAALFVCVRRAVLDVVGKEKRDRLRHDRAAAQPTAPPRRPDDALHARERFEWILSRLPANQAEALTASLSAGRAQDAEVARQLGITHSAFTARLFKARRAAEQLARYFDLLPPDQANLMAAVRYSGKTHAQVAHDLCLLRDELSERFAEAVETLERKGKVVAS